MFVYDKEKPMFMLASYIDKQKVIKKNNYLLTNTHDKLKITKNQRLKHQVHMMYDPTKKSFDVADLLLTSH